MYVHVNKKHVFSYMVFGDLFLLFGQSNWWFFVT